MVLGISLTFDKLNLFQIFLHFLGCLFTIWFVLDTWRYTYMWFIWGFFGLIPFILEVLIIVGAASFSKQVGLNSRGDFRA
jgi:hypothetical protein